MKRFFDLVISIVALITLAPVLLVIALWIVMDSGLPFYFKHRRIGKNGVSFNMYKFRTMYNNSEDVKGITLGKIDQRITFIGRHLRRFKLDELPQLFNILRNEMSLVGYRPQVPYYVEKFKELYTPLLQEKPGIVSTAAIQYRNEENLLAEQQNPELYFEKVLIPKKCALDKLDMERLTVKKYLSLLIYFFFSYFLTPKENQKHF